MRCALAGNPNSGKTSLFNKLTGSRYPVGNRAGVTVEPVSAPSAYGEIFDLPGVYSLNRPVNEELAAAAFLENERPDLVIDVVDATHLVRNLYLTSQLINSGANVVVALNMCDELKKRGATVDCEKLSDLLGCPVVPISARYDKSFDRLFEVKQASRRRRAFPTDAQACYAELEQIGAQVLTEVEKRSFADKIDAILLNKYLAFPIFLLIMCAILVFSVGVFGNFLGGLIEELASMLSDALRNGLTDLSDVTVSLLCDGITAGVGGVLQFLPLVAVMTFFLTLLEDCGYLARVAYVTDRLFASIGLSGRTAICLVLGCSCTVPAILSARTIPDDNERERCLTCVHFMPCSAKLPLLSMFAAAFFGNNLLIVPCAYLVGACAVILFNLLSPRRTEGDFIMEMPSLKAPHFANVFGQTLRKLRSFLLRTCTVVFCASVIVWVLINVDFGFRLCDIEDSMLARAGEYLKYLFYPVGFTDWRASVGVVAGFAGKETVVGVLEVLSYGNPQDIFTAPQAVVFILFMLLSSPCAAALSALRKELGSGKKFLACLIKQTAIAYAVCALVNLGFVVCRLL